VRQTGASIARNIAAFGCSAIVMRARSAGEKPATSFWKAPWLSYLRRLDDGVVLGFDTVHLASTESLVPRMARRLGDRIVAEETTLEAAAAVLADEVYVALDGAVVLTRVFGIMPCGTLPGLERERAEQIAARASPALTVDSPVLVLLASRGVNREWNDRKRSARHLAMPLASPAYVEALPMVASLLRDLRTEPGMGGMRTFYVFDARTSVDAHGRHTIPDREFVQQHDVRTVIGVGGALG
jgi:hypothetical protein